LTANNEKDKKKKKNLFLKYFVIVEAC